MKKYALVFRTSFKQESKTTLNTLVHSIGYILLIYIFMQLWSYIYGTNGGGEVISGFTLNMMIWYLVITEAIVYGSSINVTTESFTSDIRSGKIAYQLTRPYNYFNYQIVRSLAASVFRLLFVFTIGMGVGYAFAGPIPNFSIVGFLLSTGSLFMGVFIRIIIFSLIGMLSFWVENSKPFMLIVSKIFFIFGLFFPPDIFSGTLKTLVIYSPMNAALSGPAKLFVNFSWPLFLETTILQVIYLVIFVAIGFWMLRRGSKKVNIYGG